jgi:hypothetical protein
MSMGNDTISRRNIKLLKNENKIHNLVLWEKIYSITLNEKQKYMGRSYP